MQGRFHEIDVKTNIDEGLLVAGAITGLIIGTYIASVDASKYHYPLTGALIGLSFPISVPVLGVAAMFNLATK